MSLPQVVGPDEWLAARRSLLTREKELTRARDALAAERRRLPMVRVEKDYRFTGPQGEVTLPDLFDGRRQLVVQHFMFDPSWDEGCSSCTAMADELSDGLREHLHRRDTTYAAVSRAPLPKLRAVQQAKGWTFGWFSSHGSDFNVDFHVTLDPSVAPTRYNFRDADELVAAGMGWLTEYRGEQPGISCFLRDGETVFHTYSAYGRGVEAMMPGYQLLDLTALGRQEVWEEPRDRAPVVYPAHPAYPLEPVAPSTASSASLV